ncbi:MAG: DNA repair protein RecN, partial [Cyclobacteriaceae bacterium]|nr:DNA repair protein RecN [Cyclobacteriaceae bacterium]
VFKAEDLDYDNTTVIRREISPGGKSRAFINDTPVTLEVMKKISSLLLDVHSQHETLLLGQQSFQLALVDAFAENENLRNDYTLAWKTYLATKKEYETLKAEAETLKAESDYIRFQLDELVKADLHDLDQAKLESEAKIMEHAEEIKQRFRTSLAILQDGEYASRNSISEVRSLIQQVNAYAEKYNTLFGRIDSLLIELDDIIDELEREESSIDFDAERAEFVKERISTLYRLLKKHRLNDVAALIALQEELQEKANITDNVDEALATRKKAYEQAEKELKALAKKLSDTRHKVFAALAKEITSPLKELGIATAVIEFESQPVEPNATGADKIDILFSANKGISPRPLAQVASGGEFARLMFCIKQVMAEKQA